MINGLSFAHSELQSSKRLSKCVISDHRMIRLAWITYYNRLAYCLERTYSELLILVNEFIQEVIICFLLILRLQQVRHCEYGVILVVFLELEVEIFHIQEEIHIALIEVDSDDRCLLIAETRKCKHIFMISMRRESLLSYQWYHLAIAQYRVLFSQRTSVVVMMHYLVQIKAVLRSYELVDFILQLSLCSRSIWSVHF